MPNQPPWPAQPGWPPPPGWPTPGWPTPPPRRSSASLLVVILIGLLTAIIAVAAVGTFLIVRQQPSAPTPTATSADPRPGRATPSPTPVRPSPDQPSDSPNPPPGDDPQDQLARNPLLAQQIEAVSCDVPLTLPENTATYTAYFRKLFDCGQRAYEPGFERAGLTLVPPKMIIFRGEVGTPCGQGNNQTPAFYCPPNQTIYVSTMILESSILRFRLGTYYLAYHEYAHHIQQQNGSWTAAMSLDDGDLNQVMRRVELQADCFSMLQIDTLTRYTDEDWAELKSWRDYASDATHGQTASQLYWLDRGLKGRQQFARCNTWTAKEHVN